MYSSILGSCSSSCFQFRRDLGFSWEVAWFAVTSSFKICLWGKRNRGSSSWWRQAIQAIHVLCDHLMLHLFLWWRVESRLGNIFYGLQRCSLLLLLASSVQVTWLWMYVQGLSHQCCSCRIPEFIEKHVITLQHVYATLVHLVEWFLYKYTEWRRCSVGNCHFGDPFEEGGIKLGKMHNGLWIFIC